MTTEITVPESRLVGDYRSCALFSHFDSRGGSMLVNRPSFIEAVAAYVETFCPDSPEIDPERRMFNDLTWTAADDFVGSVRLLVFDVPLEPGVDTEMDERYEGQYYIGKLQMRLHGPNGWSKWAYTDVIVASVLGSGSRPDWPMDEIEKLYHARGSKLMQFRVRRHNFGEDAFGLRWI